MKIVKENIEFKRGIEPGRALELGEYRKIYEYDPNIPNGYYFVQAEGIVIIYTLIEIYEDSQKIKRIKRLTEWKHHLPVKSILIYGPFNPKLSIFMRKYTPGNYDGPYIQRIDLEFKGKWIIIKD